MTDDYARRCAVTGERTLPVLDAARIKPYAMSGKHRIDNGLLVRKDLHTSSTPATSPSRRISNCASSRRIREEFENGRDYYALDGRDVRLPVPPNPPPSSDHLEWHGDMVFRG